MLTLKNISRTYNKGFDDAVEALKGVSLEIGKSRTQQKALLNCIGLCAVICKHLQSF